MSEGTAPTRQPQRILVTGSSDYLGAALVVRLRSDGHHAIGLDRVASPTTDCVGSVADRERVRDILRRHEIEAIAHTAARRHA